MYNSIILSLKCILSIKLCNGNIMLLLSAPPLYRRMVEGSNNLSTHTGRWYPPSNWNLGPLVDWCSPSIQPKGAPREPSTNP